MLLAIDLQGKLRRRHHGEPVATVSVALGDAAMFMQSKV
jgi:hypothetical protein